MTQGICLRNGLLVTTLIRTIYVTLLSSGNVAE